MKMTFFSTPEHLGKTPAVIAVIFSAWESECVSDVDLITHAEASLHVSWNAGTAWFVCTMCSSLRS